MIRLTRPPLSTVLPDAAAQARLAARIAKAAKLPANAKKITSRWNSFVAGRGLDKSIGPTLCRAVRAVAWEKCASCEAPKAATVDHFWPKSLYPQRMFVWDNLFPACRDCNSEKRAEFPLDAGRPVLLNPVDDEPLDHFRWDHVTGECSYAPTDRRAQETHRGFALDRLKAERLHKLSNLRGLFTLIERGERSATTLSLLRAELDPTRPYLGIVRSYLLFPPNDDEARLVRAAVAAVPDIVAWTAAWLRPPPSAHWPPA